MKTLSLAILSSYLFLLACESDHGNYDGAIIENSRNLPEVTRILFIGNSHTNRNNIPKTIQFMASSAGDSTYSHNETQPGYSLAMHCARAETMRTIDSLDWDYVVLQEQGGIQAYPEALIDTGVYQYHQNLIDAIQRNCPQTIIILYMAHAYRDGVLTFGGTEWASLDPQVATYTGMQDRIRDNYIEMSRIFDSEVAPGGVLWKLYCNQYPDINIYNADGIHALPNGSYILACSIYSTIYRKNPMGKFIPADVKNSEGMHIQQMVYQSLFHLNPNWRHY